MRDPKLLHPILQDKISKLKSECQKKGLKIGIGECLRTTKEQDDLYAKGRTMPGNIVTNARGSTFSSMHQWGVAFDFYRNDGKGAYNDADGFFTKVGKIGQSLGLEWGGSWKSIIDKPHFQLPDWGSTAALLKKRYGTPEKFMKTWKEEEAMTAEEKKMFQALSNEVSAIKAELTNLKKEIASKHFIYDYIDENMPEWCKPIVQKGIEAGMIRGTSVDDNGNIITLGLTMQDIKAIAYDLRERGLM